jgi:hypothetical protein
MLDGGQHSRYVRDDRGEHELSDLTTLWVLAIAMVIGILVGLCGGIYIHVTAEPKDLIGAAAIVAGSAIGAGLTVGMTFWLTERRRLAELHPFVADITDVMFEVEMASAFALAASQEDEAQAFIEGTNMLSTAGNRVKSILADACRRVPETLRAVKLLQAFMGAAIGRGQYLKGEVQMGPLHDPWQTIDALREDFENISKTVAIVQKACRRYR